MFQGGNQDVAYFLSAGAFNFFKKIFVITIIVTIVIVIVAILIFIIVIIIISSRQLALVCFELQFRGSPAADDNPPHAVTSSGL